MNSPGSRRSSRVLLGPAESLKLNESLSLPAVSRMVLVRSTSETTPLRLGRPWRISLEPARLTLSVTSNSTVTLRGTVSLLTIMNPGLSVGPFPSPGRLSASEMNLSEPIWYFELTLTPPAEPPPVKSIPIWPVVGFSNTTPPFVLGPSWNASRPVESFTTLIPPSRSAVDWTEAPVLRAAVEATASDPSPSK